MTSSISYQRIDRRNWRDTAKKERGSFKLADSVRIMRSGPWVIQRNECAIFHLPRNTRKWRVDPDTSKDAMEVLSKSMRNPEASLMPAAHQDISHRNSMNAADKKNIILFSLLFWLIQFLFVYFRRHGCCSHVLMCFHLNRRAASCHATQNSLFFLFLFQSIHPSISRFIVLGSGRRKTNEASKIDLIRREWM